MKRIKLHKCGEFGHVSIFYQTKEVKNKFYRSVKFCSSSDQKKNPFMIDHKIEPTNIADSLFNVSKIFDER